MLFELPGSNRPKFRNTSTWFSQKIPSCVCTILPLQVFPVSPFISIAHSSKISPSPLPYTIMCKWSQFHVINTAQHNEFLNPHHFSSNLWSHLSLAPCALLTLQWHWNRNQSALQCSSHNTQNPSLLLESRKSCTSWSLSSPPFS